MTTELKQQRTLKVLGTRPTQTPDGKVVPANAVIYNAPRPLYGSVILQDGPGMNGAYRLTWEGEFICGIFFAAVIPDDQDAHVWHRANRQNHATILEYVTIKDVRAQLLDHYVTGGDADPATCKAWVDDSDDKEVLQSWRASGLGEALGPAYE